MHTDSLLSYRSKAPDAERAHPTEEHFLPLLVALGATSDAEDVIAIDGGMTYGVLSMDSFAWGLLDEIEPPAHSRQRFTVGY